MPRKSKTKKTVKPKIKHPRIGLIGWFQRNKIISIFIIIFALIGGTLIFKSFAAVGDELQAKNNSTWNFSIARRMVMSSDGSYGFTLDGYGALHPFHTYGSQPAKPTGGPYFSGQDIARDIVVSKWSTSNSQGYVLDGFGGIHPFGGAPAAKGGAYWNGWDIARKIVLSGGGGYVLDGFGALHPFAIGTGTAPAAPRIGQGPYWAGQDIARDITIRSDGKLGQILDCHGGITPVGFGSTNAPGYVNGFPYNKDRCDYTSFSDVEWSKPSGTVTNAKGEFAGFGTRTVKPFVASGLGKVVDGTCKYVTAQATSRCWLMDNHGAIRAFSEPNAPLFNDQEQAFFAAIKKAQEDAAAKVAINNGNSTPSGCSKSLNQIGPSDGTACIKALQSAVGAKVDGIWGPETQSKRDAKYGVSGGSNTTTFVNPPVSASYCDTMQVEVANEYRIFDLFTHLANSSYRPGGNYAAVQVAYSKAKLEITGVQLIKNDVCKNIATPKSFALSAIGNARSALDDFGRAIAVYLNP